MALIRTSAPAQDPVTLAEIKEHLRVDQDLEDARITDFVRSATQRLDGRDGMLGRCLITQTWKLLLEAFPAEIVLPLPPCQSVSSIAYVDSSGAAQTLAVEAYQVFGLGGAEPARIRPAYGSTWPTTRDQPEAVTVLFTAGYGDDPADIPEPIRTAIKQQVGHLYEHRESVMLGPGFVAEVPEGDHSALHDFKTWSF